ncbi:MAG: SCO1664 family protein [Anaerolineae bacterium]|nr:SCO1664 family protein [Anaerolineae bacterium]
MTDRPPEQIEVDSPRILQLLTRGEISVQGLIPWSSNATMLVTVADGELSTLAVYKPQRGERPLWDFARGTLGTREVAAYLLSEALGWGLVPPTVAREGSYGIGSVQLFIHARDDAHFFTIQHDPAYADELRRLAAFDVVVNNADRKSGHCLIDHAGNLWAIDNALTFHEQPKLRTVIWDFAGERLPADLAGDLDRLERMLREGGEVSSALAHLLTGAEVDAMRKRLGHLVAAGCFPEPGPGRHVPWPLV